MTNAFHFERLYNSEATFLSLTIKYEQSNCYFNVFLLFTLLYHLNFEINSSEKSMIFIVKVFLTSYFVECLVAIRNQDVRVMKLVKGICLYEIYKVNGCIIVNLILLIIFYPLYGIHKTSYTNVYFG
jgi:hypothetical protein